MKWRENISRFVETQLCRFHFTSTEVIVEQPRPGFSTCDAIFFLVVAGIPARTIAFRVGKKVRVDVVVAFDLEGHFKVKMAIFMKNCRLTTSFQMKSSSHCLD